MVLTLCANFVQQLYKSKSLLAVHRLSTYLLEGLGLHAGEKVVHEGERQGAHVIASRLPRVVHSISNGRTAVARRFYSAVTTRRQRTHLASYALVPYLHDLMSAAAVGRPPASRRSTSVSSGSTHSPSSSISKGATARAAASPRVPSNLSPASRRGSIKAPSPPALTGETRESLALALRHETDAKEQVWPS